MRSIVVPVDFTPNSDSAARYAADLAAAINADVHLIHVFQPPLPVSGIPLPESVYQELTNFTHRSLKDLSDQLVKRTGGKIRVGTQLEVGNIGTFLQGVCKEKNPLIVVMGASANSLENLVEGRHTARLLRQLRHPVLVIPEKTRWHPVRTIVAACDKEDIDGGMPSVLPFLDELSRLLNARLEVLHVITNGEGNTIEAINEYNVWRRNVSALAPDLHFVRQANVQKGVNDYLENHETDWLMVFPKTHSMLEFHTSRAKQIVLDCPIPVMSVHE